MQNEGLRYGFVFTFQLSNLAVCRGSSGVEQLIRNQQVVGSIPILGSHRELGTWSLEAGSVYTKTLNTSKSVACCRIPVTGAADQREDFVSEVNRIE
jgi:hypothetical protein